MDVVDVCTLLNRLAAVEDAVLAVLLDAVEPVDCEAPCNAVRRWEISD